MTTLNQIYYGAPGTGKTFSSVEDALRIVNSNKTTEDSVKQIDVKPFDLILQVIRTRYSSHEFLAKTNSIYRNDRAIMWMLGYLLMPQFDSANELSNVQAKSVGFDESPSSWAQRSQFISQFHFVDDWRESAILKLNDNGIDLKNLVRDKYTVDVLKNWDAKECPKEIQQAYFNVLANEPLENFTPMIKTFYCALRMLNDGNLYKKNESVEPTQTERDEAERYFDLPVGTKDLKWIGQIGRIFEGIGIAKQQQNKTKDRYLFEITDFGKLLIDRIVERWKKEKPEIFELQINYSSALELGLIKFITFHQSYSYEEFIEGIRPILDSDEGLTYSLNSGIFKEFCSRAKHNLSSNYVLIIDEINRGNISKIFGELITLIESTKRLYLDAPEEPNEALLPYSKTLFGVPKNVHLIGTMNSVDKSITTLDTALRRRFKFIEFSPNLELLKNKFVTKDKLQIPLAPVLRDINQRIEYLLDRDHQIGHSYFMKVSNWDELCLCFRDEIIPLLKEYFFTDWEKIALVLGDNSSRGKSEEDKFITQKNLDLQRLFGDQQMSFESGQIFAINEKLVSGSFSNLSGDLIAKSFDLK